MTEEEIENIEVGGKIDPKPPYTGSEEVYEVKMPHAGIKGRIIKYSDTEWAFATGLSLEALSTGPGEFTSLDETLDGVREFCRRRYSRDLPKGNA